MITISLCMIVKNEENTLSRCLDSVRGAVDEIIIVDTGSSDRTVEIAKRYTDKVYGFERIDDFSAARNFAFSKASSEYCMWLDADDVILKDDFEQLKNLKASLDKSCDIVMMPYHTAFDESGKPLFVYYRERIIKNLHRDLWQGEIHEAITPFGNVIYSDAAVTHKKEGDGEAGRNLRIFRKILKKRAFSPREQFYYARELYYAKEFKDAIAAFNEFLGSDSGWIENKIDACLVLGDCYFAIGDNTSALSALSRSFFCDSPRAEACCRIGAIMFALENYTEAIFWYSRALAITPNDKSGGFVLIDCYGFIPAIWLCVCYDKLGNREKAKEYNELALSFKPYSPEALANKKYFDTL